MVADPYAPNGNRQLLDKRLGGTDAILTLSASSNPHDQSNEEKTKGSEDLSEEGLEQRVLQGRIGREHELVGSLDSEYQEPADDQYGDGLRRVSIG